MQHHYKLRSSRLYIFLIVFLSAASLVCLWLMPLPVWAALALTGGVLCWACYCLLRDARLSLQRSCIAFRLEEPEQIMLVLRNGSHLPGRVLPDSLVTPYLVILNIVLAEQRGKRSVMIFPDSMGAESLRRLRVLLRWGGRASRPASL